VLKLRGRGRPTNKEIVKPFVEEILRLKAELQTLAEEEKKLEKEPDSLAKFERFLNIARGKVDIKYRLRLLLDPDNIKTTTRLSRSQVDFAFLCDFTAAKFEEEGFGGLSEFATEFRLSNISLEGKGRTEAIQYEGAIGESKLLQKLNIFGTQQAREKGKE